MSKYIIVFSWLLVLATFIPGFDHGIWRPDEPQVAGVCSEAARTGDFVVPRLNGKPFLEKPPLYYDACALSSLVFGKGNELAYRGVSLAFGILTVFTVFSLVRRRSGRTAGLVAAGILASIPGFFMLARWIQVDTALVFFVTLAMSCYLKIREKPSWPSSVILGLALGLAFMSKGLIGPAVFVSALLMDILVQRDLRIVWRLRPFTVFACACLPVLPWAAGLYSHGGWPFLREILIVNNFMRFLGSPEGAALGHQHGPLYYLTRMPQDVLPWTLLLIPALISSVRNYKNDPYLSWFIAPFILMSIASTKRTVYLMPIYPAFACMISTWLMDAAAKKPWENVMIRVTAAVAVIGCFVPFAGIFLHRPVLSVAMGILSLGLLLFLRSRQKTAAMPGQLALVLMVCVAFTCVMPVYFSYMKPKENYLGAAQEILSAAQGRPVTIYLGEDEILDGLFPMLKGGTYPTRKAGNELAPGYYAWVETRKLKATREITEKGSIRIILTKAVGNKNAVLAEFTPHRP